MNEFVSKSIGDDAKFKGLQAEMVTISIEFSKESAEYVHSEYQCYIAACTVHNCKTRCAFQLGSGQGKTIVALLIARYYEKHERSVKIVTASKLLAMQVRELLYSLSKNSNRIDVTIPKHIGAKDPDWDAVICDEADYLFEQKNFSFFK